MTYRVGKIILGTVQLGLNYGINNSNGKTPKEEAFKILRLANDKGICDLDTAAVYGDSERVIGEFIETTNAPYNIITKINLKSGWKDSFLRSLYNLKQPSVDTLLLHSFQDYLTINENLNDLISWGRGSKFKKLGVSLYTNAEIESVLGDDRIEVIQIPFNLLDNHTQKGDLLKRCKVKRKEIHARSAFLQGLFFIHPKELPAYFTPIKQDLQTIHRLADQAHVNIGALALKYSLSKSYIDKVLIGVETANQLSLNLQWMNSFIAEDILSEIDTIQVQKTSLLNPSKWVGR